MKYLLLFALYLIGAGMAQAQTVNLQQTGPCLYAYYCTDVQNDAGAVIPDLVYSTHYGRVTMTIDGVQWDTGLYALGANLPAGLPTVTLTNVALYDPEGNVLYLTVTFVGGEVTGKCRQSGRVCVFPHAPVYITGGTIVQ